MSEDQATLIELAASIVASYVENNSVIPADLPALIASTHAALSQLGAAPTAPVVETHVPAISIKKSITPEFLICLEDGKKFKSLKRHLNSKYGLSPEQYRVKWGLPADYPMVAPAYAEARSNLAKSMGLGRKPAPKEAAPKAVKMARRKAA